MPVCHLVASSSVMMVDEPHYMGSSTDRDSALEIHHYQGQYAKNPSTITLGPTDVNNPQH